MTNYNDKSQTPFVILNLFQNPCHKLGIGRILKRVQDDNRRRGFTMVEAIIYIAIFSVFFVGLIGFFWQMRQAEIDSDVKRRVKENASQVVEAFKYVVRNADSLDTGNSNLEINPSHLELVDSTGNWALGTYSKNVDVGGVSVPINTLRLFHSGEGTFDLTSGQVTVTQFEVNDLTQTDPVVLQLKLGLDHVNPGNDPLYDHPLNVVISVLIREEL